MDGSLSLPASHGALPPSPSRYTIQDFVWTEVPLPISAKTENEGDSTERRWLGGDVPLHPAGLGALTIETYEGQVESPTSTLLPTLPPPIVPTTPIFPV